VYENAQCEASPVHFPGDSHNGMQLDITLESGFANTMCSFHMILVLNGNLAFVQVKVLFGTCC